MENNTLDNVGNSEEKEEQIGENKGHYVDVDELPGQLWYPENIDDRVAGVFMEMRPANKYESLIVLKEHPDDLAKQERQPNEETIVPGWAVIHKRFLNIKQLTQVRITYTGEKQTKDGKGTAKQFKVEEWKPDE